MRDWVKIGLLYLLSLPVLIGTWERLVFVAQGAVGAPWVDQRYADHPWLSALHLMPGAVFFLLGPLQFSSWLRRGPWHRWAGRLFILTGTLSGIAVIWMVWVFPAVGGLMTQAVTMAIVGAMICFMSWGWRCARRRQIPQHRGAMMRAYALGLSVSTTRIFIDLAEVLAGLDFMSTFVPASAAGVAVNVLFTEALLRRKGR